jgi:hypothetical protein
MVGQIGRVGPLQKIRFREDGRLRPLAPSNPSPPDPLEPPNPSRPPQKVISYQYRFARTARIAHTASPRPDPPCLKASEWSEKT